MAAKEKTTVCSRPECLMAKKHQKMSQFLPSRDLQLSCYPLCKTCLNEITDLEDMETVFRILKVIDTPFIRSMWDDIVIKNNADYLVKYINKLNTKTMAVKYADWRYSDSIFVPTSGEMEGVSDNKRVELAEQFKDIAAWSDDWQGEYTSGELKILNNYLNGLLRDFKIETATQKDYAKKIAKTSLEADKALNKVISGEPGAEKKYNDLMSTFDKLSKTAKFAESERSRTDVSLGNFGKVFEAVEEHNWVPTYEIEDKDMFDKILEQFSTINKSL